MRIHTLSILGLSLYATSTFAMFCPNNLNQIEFGNDLKQVEQQCGKPAAAKTYQKSLVPPQEWNYYKTVPPANQGTLKVSFVIVNDQVINMSVNGIGVGASPICGPNLQLGSTKDEVENACGKPVMINQSSPQPGEKPPTPTDVAEWKYDGPPPTVLIFENGKLKERKQM